MRKLVGHSRKERECWFCEQRIAVGETYENRLEDGAWRSVCWLCWHDGEADDYDYWYDDYNDLFADVLEDDYSEDSDAFGAKRKREASA